MYSLIRKSTWKDVFQNEAGPLLAAGITAELFFKWHSFTLEALGFLTVWYAFGWALSKVRTAGAVR